MNSQEGFLYSCAFLKKILVKISQRITDTGTAQLFQGFIRDRLPRPGRSSIPAALVLQDCQRAKNVY